ncbi:MAG: MaoC family dehydratase [Pseudomonadota bacterium]
MEKIAIADLQAKAGELKCTSPWVDITQDLVNTFADATHDHQFIHVDLEKAKMTPFGGTIAHGFLSLSLLSKFASDCLPGVEGAVMGINYGFDKVRFLMPVPATAKLRGHFKLLECGERKPGEYLSKYEVSVEIENNETPALVAEWLTLTVVR